MKLFTRTYLLSLLLFTFLFTGCLKDDLSDCPSGLKVYFTYEPASYAKTGINEAEIERIDLFVFDTESNILRGVYVDQTPQLSPDYYMTINNLPVGDYSFIAWCGVPTHYRFEPNEFIVGQTTFKEAFLILQHNNVEVDGAMPLFHAKESAFVKNRGDVSIHLPLQQAYNTIHLTTEGLQQSNDIYRLTIMDNNGKYDFDYSFVADGDLTYTTQCDRDDEGQLRAALNTLKLAADRHPVIRITNETTGTVLFSEDLVSMINAIENMDYDRIHEYDIHLRFGLSVSVNINGWWVVEDGQIGL